MLVVPPELPVPESELDELGDVGEGAAGSELAAVGLTATIVTGAMI